MPADPSSLFKELLPLLLHSFLVITKKSLASGSMPSAFKIAFIKPLLKIPNLDPLVLNNYRPVSNVPFMSKILEKAVADQLTTHLSQNRLFEKV